MSSFFAAFKFQFKWDDFLSEMSPSQPNEASPPYVLDRVLKKNNMQGHVLPSWTCISRPPTLTETPPTQFTTGRKRPTQSQVSNDFSEFPSKRFQASQKDDGVLFILAKVDHQPC